VFITGLLSVSGFVRLQAISELLFERLTMVNDVTDYGSELAALTGCQQISVDADELSRWHDCLRQNARHKATEITAALQRTASHVSHFTLQRHPVNCQVSNVIRQISPLTPIVAIRVQL